MANNGRFMNGIMRKWRKALIRLRLASALLKDFDVDPRRRGVSASFSQGGEDLLVLKILEGRGVKNFSYLDIGANHPYHLNNTALMYILGGRGINIEPNPVQADLIRRARPRDITLNIGAAAENGEMDFFVMSQSVSCTFDRQEAEKLEQNDGNQIKRVLPISVRKVAEILTEYDFHPHFISVDVEGMDLEILKSIDWNATRPVAVCVETLDYFTQCRRPEIVDFMRECGYRIHADTHINTIFIK